MLSRLEDHLMGYLEITHGMRAFTPTMGVLEDPDVDRFNGERRPVSLCRYFG